MLSMYTSQPVIVAGAEQLACKVKVVPTVALLLGCMSVTVGPLTTVIVSVSAVLPPTLSHALITTVWPPDAGVIEVFSWPLVSLFFKASVLST